MSEVAKESDAQFTKGIAADSLNPLNYIGLGMVILLEKNDTSAADVYFNKAESILPKKKSRSTLKKMYKR